MEKYVNVKDGFGVMNECETNVYLAWDMGSLDLTQVLFMHL
jgi:hypothetical protein